MVFILRVHVAGLLFQPSMFFGHLKGTTATDQRPTSYGGGKTSTFTMCQSLNGKPTNIIIYADLTKPYRFVGEFGKRAGKGFGQSRVCKGRGKWLLIITAQGRR